MDANEKDTIDLDPDKTPCPDEPTLKSFLEKTAADQELSKVADHLERCAKCKASIEELAQNPGDTFTFSRPDGDTDIPWNSQLAGKLAEALLPEMQSSEPVLPEVDGYEILSAVAKGGMGIVYKARQIKANRIVALKMLLNSGFADAEMTQRFLVEAKNAARLNHANIVSVFDVGTSHGNHFFSMEFVDGQSLRDKLNERPLANRETARMLLAITDAVAYAHEQGIVHRDLKPANVMLSLTGQPLVTDFGLAKHLGVDDQMTTTGQILGTPSYMSPEQASGEAKKVGQLADVYALGAILYTMLTGRPPFQAANPMDTVLQVIRQPPVSPRELNPDVDQDLETICLKCLEKEPASRYESARAVAEELQRYLDGVPIVARPINALERTWRLCKRHPAVAVLTCALFVTLLAGSLISLRYAIRANRKAEQATAQATMTMGMVEHIIDTIQDKLRFIPGARELRRELLESTLAELEKIQDEASLDARIQQSKANIFVDVGDLYISLGDEDKQKNVAKAERYLKQGVEIFARLTRQNKNPNESFLVDHSRALDMLGMLYRNSGRAGLAIPLIDQGLRIRQQLVQLVPDKIDYQHRLAVSMMGLSECYSQLQKLDQARSFNKQSLEIAKSLFEKHKERIDFAANLFLCQKNSAYLALDEGDLEQAAKLFENSLGTARFYLTNYPETAFSHDFFALAYEGLGEIELARSELEKAKEYFMKMKDSLEKARNLDSEDIYFSEGLLSAYEQLEDVYRIMGDSDQQNHYSLLREDLNKQLNR